MQRLINSLPLLSMFLVLVAFTYFAVAQWQGFQSELETFKATEKQRPIANSATSPPHPKQRIDRNLASFKLFGDANAAKPVVVEKEPEKLPETRLNLTLRGVSASSRSPSRNDDYNHDYVDSALIEDARRDTKLYRVGDSITGGAMISAIYPDRVVISRNGRKENLYFPKVSIGGGNLIAANQSSSSNINYDNPNDTDTGYFDNGRLQQNGRFNDDEEEGESDTLAPRVSPQRTQSIKDRLDAIRSRIRADRNQ